MAKYVFVLQQDLNTTELNDFNSRMSIKFNQEAQSHCDIFRQRGAEI